ncbi:MAG: peroxiredoxin [Burkholderiaceae bacterium]|jgi:peroxiredoxin
MALQIGDRIPDGTLHEFNAVGDGSCPVGPRACTVSDLVRGKRIALFAVPGAFTPTCSDQHLPGFLTYTEQLRAKGVNEIWCVAVNDPYVMHAWGERFKVGGRMRLLADGSAAWTRSLGLVWDLSTAGFGIRSQRYSMLLDDGVIGLLNIENEDEFIVSNAETLLRQIYQSARKR